LNLATAAGKGGEDHIGGKQHRHHHQQQHIDSGEEQLDLTSLKVLRSARLSRHLTLPAVFATLCVMSAMAVTLLHRLLLLGCIATDLFSCWWRGLSVVRPDQPDQGSRSAVELLGSSCLPAAFCSVGALLSRLQPLWMFLLALPV